MKTLTHIAQFRPHRKSGCHVGRGLILPFLFIILFTSRAQDRPNILWINCDDLGTELGCYGNPDVKTPNIDRIAAQGIRFSRAYANASVCSASRSSQITGMYPSAINLLNHRTMEKRPLSGVTPTVMQLFQDAGYFCSNGWAHNMNKPGKEDYNFSGKNFFDGTDWNQRKSGQPFFAQVQIHEPHRVFVEDEANPVNPLKVTLPGCYPDHPIIRADWALYLESVQIADKRVGIVLDRLEKEGLLENTIIFLFGDHGRPHLRDKQWLYEGGLKIPVIARYPKYFKGGKTRKDLISLVDVTVSSLAFANLEVPDHMHGKDVLGGEKRDYVLGFRQRCGDAPDDIRSITDGRYKLIWNREPERPYMQLTSYKKAQYPAFTLYNVLHKKGELSSPYNLFMAKSRPDYEFYDLKKDPDELNNLVNNPKFAKRLFKLKGVLESRLELIEKDMFKESDENVQNAISGSAKFFESQMNKINLPGDVSDEDLLKHWEKKLLK